MKDTVYNFVRAVRTLSPAARTNGTVNGTGADRQLSGAAGTNEWHESATVVINTGTVTDGSHAFTVEDSPDNSVWTAVAAGLLQGSAPTVVAADDDKVFEVGYLGNQRYLRAVVVTTGATTGGIFGAVVLLGFPTRPPIVRT